VEEEDAFRAEQAKAEDDGDEAGEDED